MNLLEISQPPHIKAKDDTRIIMADVLLALMPAMIAGVYFFGYRALLISIISVASSIVFEHLWNVIAKKPTTVTDLSCVVSGVLLAFNLPVSVPLWIPVVGSLFMIVVVKMCFGGLGQNFMNPALAARAFLVMSWTGIMTTKFYQTGTKFSIFGEPLSVDATTAATPLRALAAGMKLPSYLDLFIGNVGGCIGETSALALLIGAAYLFARRIISWQIPVSFIAVTAVFSFAVGIDPLFSVLSGGLLLGAFFMATDYATSPVTPKGRIMFGVGCGIITVIIRKWGGYPEGVSYAILLMNVLTPVIDKITLPKRFGKQVKEDA